MPNPAQHEGLIVFLAFIGVIYAILMFFLPFFIYRIRNESIRANKYLEVIATTLTNQKPAK